MKTLIVGPASLRRAVRCRRDALEHRLQEFILELLAAIVLIAIFVVLAEPAAPAGTGAKSSVSGMNLQTLTESAISRENATVIPMPARRRGMPTEDCQLLAAIERVPHGSDHI
jgi:hypothetical protein